MSLDEQRSTSASVADLAIAQAQVDLHDERPRTLAQDPVQQFVRLVLGPLERELRTGPSGGQRRRDGLGGRVGHALP